MCVRERESQLTIVCGGESTAPAEIASFIPASAGVQTSRVFVDREREREREREGKR